MKMGIDSLQAKHGLILGLALLGSIVLGSLGVGAAMGFGTRFATSVALGGGMQVINLYWLERSVRTWALRARQAPAGAVSFAGSFRMLSLLAAVAAVFFLVPVQPIGLTLGLSTAVPAVLWHGLATAGREV